MQNMVSRSRFVLGSLVIAAAAAAGCAGLKPMLGMDSSVSLSGAQEVPPVSTSAAGTMKYAVASDMTLSGTVETMGIVGTAAHIHDGAMGVNGPVIIPLNRTSSSNWAVPPGTRLTEAQHRKLKAGELYVNVHSDAYKGGGIRAQLKP